MKFEFKEKGHRYTLDGKPLTGVTTILNVIAKPMLIGWSARMASEYVLENLKDLKDLKTVCELAKKAHTQKRDKAGKAGTDVHAIIENWIKTAIAENNGVIKKDGPELPPNTESDNKQVQNFIEWATKNKVKFLESEKKLYSKKHWIAGTCDFTCEINGKRFVGDTKTSSGIYDRTPHFQTAGYRLMLEEMGEGSNVKDSFLARTGRKLKGVKIDKPIYHGSVIVNIKKSGIFTDKDVHYSYDYETDLKGFMACLELYRSLNTFKQSWKK